MKDNLEYAAIVIVAISLLPVAVEFHRGRRQRRSDDVRDHEHPDDDGDADAVRPGKSTAGVSAADCDEPAHRDDRGDEHDDGTEQRGPPAVIVEEGLSIAWPGRTASLRSMWRARAGS